VRDPTALASLRARTAAVRVTGTEQRWSRRRDAYRINKTHKRAVVADNRSELLTAAENKEWDKLMVRRPLEVVRYLQRM
jgi:hypothetical protein